MVISHIFANDVMYDVPTFLIFGVFAWLGRKVAPFIIGFILGGQAEVFFVNSLESFGRLTISFAAPPIALCLWGLIAISVVFSVHHPIRTMKCRKTGDRS